MPPKRGSKTTKAKKSSKAKRATSDAGVPGSVQLDRPIDSYPAFELLPQCFDRANQEHEQHFMREMAAHFDWIMQQKVKAKELIREASGARAVPKTPKRGGLAGMAATMAMFDRAIVKEEEQTASDEDEDKAAADQHATPTTGRKPGRHQLEIEDDDDLMDDADAPEGTEANGGHDSDIMDDGPTHRTKSVTAGRDAEENEDMEEGEDGHSSAPDDPIRDSSPVAAHPRLNLDAPEDSDTDNAGGFEGEEAGQFGGSRDDVAEQDQLSAGRRSTHRQKSMAAQDDVAPTDQMPPSTPIATQVATPPAPATTVKQEPLSDRAEPVQRSTRSRAQAKKTPVPVVQKQVKEEVLSADRPQNVTPVAAEPETRRRKTRAGKSTVQRPVRGAAEQEPARTGERGPSSSRATARTPRTVTRHPKVAAVAATETASVSSPVRTPHRHLVSTPIKAERKDKVQQVIVEQDRKREASAVRAGARDKTPSRRAPVAALTKVADAKMPNTSTDAQRRQVLQKQREEQAQRLKEQQNREKAERAKKDWEERHLKVQRKREELEAVEQRKKDLAREREERAEAVRAMSKSNRSPGRTNPSSRVASPARQRLLHKPPVSESKKKKAPLATAPSTPAPATGGKKHLFPNSPSPVTPGRGPAKAAKVTALSGLVDKEATYQSPAREFRRKPSRIAAKLEPDEAMESEDSLYETNLRDERARLENERRLRHAQERERNAEMRRQREEERARQDATRRQAEEAERLQKEEIRRQREEEGRRLLLRQEEQRRASAEERRKEVDRERAAARQEEVRRQLAAEREEQRRRDAEKKEMEAEQASSMERMHLDDGEEHKPTNKHLMNASLNASQLSTSQRSPCRSSYEMTPDKVFKPSTKNNYNIDDLSSGDETDDDNAPRKKVPSWAEWANLKKTGIAQYDPNRDIQSMYGHITLPSKEQVFGERLDKKKRNRERGSSAHWTSPMSNPTKGKSRYLGY